MGLIKTFIVFLITKVLYKIFSQNLKVETININIENKQQQSTTNKSYKIVQLSDIHYDHIPLRISDSFLYRIVKTTNDLNPDLIVITGDLIERAPEPIVELYKKHLSKLKAKYGVYAILGNHDYKTMGGAEIIKKALKNTNINLLENEIVYPMGGNDNDNGIQLIGIDKYAKTNGSEIDNMYKEIKSSKLIKFVLLHNPDHVVEFQNKLNEVESNVDLVVAGHSHGSQLCIPSFGFGSNKPLMPYFEKMLTYFPKFIQDIRYPGKKTIKNWKYGKGLHQFINNSNNNIINFYINRGLGTHPPFRIFCDPEITVFNINSSNNSSKPESITYI